MIRKLRLKNFQSHPDNALEFCPGVNVIVGPSDSGKSSLIRALRWAVWNKPLGEAFRSDWGGDTSVTLFTDDARIKRFKGTGGDRYTLIQDTNKQEFRAFGTVPPAEVTEALNLHELNLQSQHDGTFLLSNTPGEVARYFNRIARIDQIDSALQRVEKWLRESERCIKNEKDSIDKYRTRLADYDHLDSLEEEVEMLERLETQMGLKWRGVNSLTKLTGDIEALDTEISKASTILAAEPALTCILAQAEELRGIEREYEALSGLVESWEEADGKVRHYRETLPPAEEVDRILEAMGKLGKFRKRAARLEALMLDVERVEDLITGTQETLAELEQQWHEEFPAECPLCGSRAEPDGKFTVGAALRRKFNGGKPQ